MDIVDFLQFEFEWKTMQMLGCKIFKTFELWCILWQQTVYVLTSESLSWLQVSSIWITTSDMDSKYILLVADMCMYFSLCMNYGTSWFK